MNRYGANIITFATIRSWYIYIREKINDIDRGVFFWPDQRSNRYLCFLHGDLGKFITVIHSAGKMNAMKVIGLC